MPPPSARTELRWSAKHPTWLLGVRSPADLEVPRKFTIHPSSPILHRTMNTNPKRVAKRSFSNAGIGFWFVALKSTAAVVSFPKESGIPQYSRPRTTSSYGLF